MKRPATDKPPADVAKLLGPYLDSVGTPYELTWCKNRGLLLQRQLSDRLSEAYPYELEAFKRQLGWKSFAKRPEKR